MNLKKIIMITVILVNGLNLLAQSSDFPKTMYVNATDGLRIRTSPSISASVIGIYNNGERVIVRERGNTLVTIGEMTDYWYKVNNDQWVLEEWNFMDYYFKTE